MQTLYEERLRSLHEQVRSLYSELERDEIVRTMKDDATCSDFLQQRVKEIVEESLASEREAFIEKLSQEVAFLKGELVRSEETATRAQEDRAALENALAGTENGRAHDAQALRQLER